MAKWGEPSDETIKAFNDVLLRLDLENFINIKIIINDDQKEVGKIKKLTPDVKFALGDDLLIIVNESIFEQIPAIQQNMYIDELLTPISYNVENERLTINPPDVKTYSGFLQKYSFEQYEVMVESIKSLYDKAKEDKLTEQEGSVADSE